MEVLLSFFRILIDYSMWVYFATIGVQDGSFDPMISEKRKKERGAACLFGETDRTEGVCGSFDSLG